MATRGVKKRKDDEQQVSEGMMTRAYNAVSNLSTTTKFVAADVVVTTAILAKDALATDARLKGVGYVVAPVVAAVYGTVATGGLYGLGKLAQAAYNNATLENGKKALGVVTYLPSKAIDGLYWAKDKCFGAKAAEKAPAKEAAKEAAKEKAPARGKSPARGRKAAEEKVEAPKRARSKSRGRK